MHCCGKEHFLFHWSRTEQIEELTCNYFPARCRRKCFNSSKFMTVTSSLQRWNQKKEAVLIDFNALLLLPHERGSELAGHMPRMAQRLFLSIDITYMCSLLWAELTSLCFHCCAKASHKGVFNLALNPAAFLRVC